MYVRMYVSYKIAEPKEEITHGTRCINLEMRVGGGGDSSPSHILHETLARHGLISTRWISRKLEGRAVLSLCDGYCDQTYHIIMCWISQA